MSSETASGKEEARQVNPESELDEETLDKIKHPPSIDNAMRELSPEELLGQAMVPQMIDDQRDLRDDLKQD